MAVIRCRHFSGYKPCGLNPVCDETCARKEIPQIRILVVHLEALGAVLRSTSLLMAIKRKYPSSHVTWVTKAPAHELLKHISEIDRVLTTSSLDLLALTALEFEVGFCVDKSLASVGLIKSTSVDVVYGFTADGSSGSIIPATPMAHELWELGLNDHKKFFMNKKTETQLTTEALELEFHRDEYRLGFAAPEVAAIEHRTRQFRSRHPFVVGLNTGCSSTIKAKKLTVAGHREIIRTLQKKMKVEIVLLGGAEDTERNREIARGLDVVSSSTEVGLRDGLISMAACDIVLTGDSLGMHMAIALKKWVVVWFGPTCAQEIDLFDRGIKVKTQAPCAPCWKRTCDKTPMCYDLVNFDELIDGVEKGLQWAQNSLSSRPRFSEIFSSQSL